MPSIYVFTLHSSSICSHVQRYLLDSKRMLVSCVIVNINFQEQIFMSHHVLDGQSMEFIRLDRRE